MLPSTGNLFFLFVSLVALTFIICATGITTLRQIFVLRQGVLSQRTLYKKRAIQSLNLVFVLNIMLFIFCAVDIFFLNKIFAHVGEELAFIVNFLLAFLLLSAILTFVWIKFLKKSEELKVFWTLALITAYPAVKAMSIIIILSFRLLYTQSAPIINFFEVIEGDNLAMLFTFYNKLFSIMLPILEMPARSVFIILFFLLSGASIGSGFQMLYTLLCRKVDDFGRDYYAQTIKVLSAAGFRASLALTLVIAIVIIAQAIAMPLVPMLLDTSAIAIILIPVALANYIMVALNQNPLRFKISIAISSLLVLIGAFFFVLQTLVPLVPVVETVVK